MDADTILELRELQTHFATDRGTARAVDGVSFRVRRGQTLAFVGESGSGKSATSLSVMRLIPTPPGRIAGGEILFRGRDGQPRDLVRLPEPAMRHVRGNEIGMIFQEPMTSLNPLHTVERQVSESLLLHRAMGRAEARARTLELGQQFQDLRLDGDVEGRGRLVGDEQLGLVGQRHGDHDALALPAGKLERVGRDN